MIKKYSDTYETDRAQEISARNSSMGPTTTVKSGTNSKQIYNRRPMSPLKNTFKPMIFSMNMRNYGKKL